MLIQSNEKHYNFSDLCHINGVYCETVFELKCNVYNEDIRIEVEIFIKRRGKEAGFGQTTFNKCIIVNEISELQNHVELLNLYVLCKSIHLTQ